MKLHTPMWLVLLFALISSSVIAQIPNSSFEEWITSGNSMKPKGWYGTNDFTDTMGSYFAITRSTDNFPLSAGSYSVRIQNNVDLLPDWSALGVLWSGGPSGNDYPAFKVSGHPVQFCGYFKFSPLNNDTMRIFLNMYLAGAEVAHAILETSVLHDEWASFCIPITEYDEADSARILLASFYPEGELTPHGNSVLWVDNLSFDSLVTGAEEPISGTKVLRVYPNPADNLISIELYMNAGPPVTLDVFNSLGQIVMTMRFNASAGKEPVNVSKLQPGQYLLRFTEDLQVVATCIVQIMR